MSTEYRGITWDHPRGRNALEAAAAVAGAEAGGVRIAWQAHSLEHFESHPIDDLAANYDLIVLDHPHLGEALEKHSLQPMDAVVGTARLERWSREAVGPSFDSYAADGYQWALPLDAATQVAVRNTALVPSAPVTWAEVEQLSTHAPVALSLAGPHAFLSFASICSAFGRPVGQDAAGAFADRATASEVLELLRVIGSRAPAGTDALNPIGLLERLSTEGDIGYIPLVYGYVNYSTPAVQFSDAPVTEVGGRIGSTIGGTGLAVSSRATVTPELVAHIEWLMSPAVQAGFIPEHDGQPSARAAWSDDAVNAASHDFYRSTLATLEDSWVRPRYSGYIPFQSQGSAIVREVVSGALTIEAGIDALEAAFAASAHGPALPFVSSTAATGATGAGATGARLATAASTSPLSERV